MHSKKWIAVVTALVLALALVPATVFAADPAVVKIDSEEALVQAIKDQSNNQIWEFTKEGEYDVFNADNYQADKTGLNNLNQKIGGYVTDQAYDRTAEYVFPIYADNITIRKAEGVGEVILTSTAVPGATYGGNGHYQNFITIAGDNVTIDGVTLKANYNAYYKGVNKVIDIMGKNSTLSNLVLTTAQGIETTDSGNIIYEGTDIGNALISNVEAKGWVSAGYAEAGNITVEKFTSDFVGNSYAGYCDETYGYGWNPGVHTKDGKATVDVKSLIIKVDGNINLNEQVFNANQKDNTAVLVMAPVAVDKMVNISANNVSLDLCGNTLTASENFTGSYENDKHLVQVLGDGAILVNGTLKTTEANKHALNVYDAQDAVLFDLTLDHTDAMKGAPLVINGSTVSVEYGLKTITGENSWYAINVDNKDGSETGAESVLVFAEGAKVTFEGKSPLGIVSETTMAGKDVTVSFCPDVTVSAAEGFVVLANGETQNGAVTIVNAENAGLEKNDDGTYGVAEKVEDEDKEESPATGDGFSMGLWVMVMLLTAAAAVVALRKKNA